MKFAFILIGEMDSHKDRAVIPGSELEMIGVSSVEEACRTARELCEGGIDCIELCGAFEEAGARRVIEATGGLVPVGYVIHLPEQDGLFKKLFG